MATYEIGDASARTIHRALDFARRCDPTAPDLTELLQVFAPPEPPTAAELAEVLQGLLDSSDNAKRAWVNKAIETLERWEASQS